MLTNNSTIIELKLNWIKECYHNGFFFSMNKFLCWTIDYLGTHVNDENMKVNPFNAGICIPFKLCDYQ